MLPPSLTVLEAGGPKSKGSRLAPSVASPGLVEGYAYPESLPHASAHIPMCVWIPFLYKGTYHVRSEPTLTTYINLTDSSVNNCLQLGHTADRDGNSSACNKPHLP